MRNGGWAIYRKFYILFKLRKGCAIYRKLDCYTVRLSTVLVLWTHEHFTIVLMAYLWQLRSRRVHLRRDLFIPAATRY